MTMRIDASDFMEFADDCERAAQRAPQVFADAAFEIGTLVQQKAQLNAMPHRRTGSMENSITPAMVSAGPSMATAEVAVTAVSDRGFPYPIVIDGGHDGIRPKAGGVLAFPGKDGKTVFTRYVKPYAGSKFFTRAVDDTRNSGDVEATVNDAVDLLLNELRG
jgi:hypothetical protein